MLALVFILVAVGLVPCLIGAIFLSVYFRNRRNAALISRVPTSAAAAVAGMRPGELVEVRGTLRCARPLRSELAGLACAYYEARVDRIYEQEERDSDGNSQTVERTETLARNVQTTPFDVEDETGRVRVTPDGAEVDARSVFDEFIERPPSGRIRLGGVTVELNYGLGTIGYRHREEVLPVDQPVYVLGVVTSDGEIARPTKGARDAGFLISYRSEQDLARSYQDDGWIMWGGIGTLALGALIIAIAIVVWLVWG